MEQQVTNPYFELGVKPGVSPKQLKQAYRQSVMRYHPDTGAGKGNTEKFRQVTEAYQLLQKMNAYEAASSSKKTVSRTSNLRQKFSLVFFKKRRQENQAEKPWWEKIDIPQNNEKIKVNRQTTNLSLEELINCDELSANQYVRQVALEAIAANRDEGGVKYLLHLLQNSEKSNRNQVIQALGQCGFQGVNKYLLAYVTDPDIGISTSAIKALERLNAANRSLVVEILRKENPTWQNSFLLQPLSKLKNKVFSVASSKCKLGDLLLRERKLTAEQLEIALLMQKRFPLLLGQILRYLNYVSIPEIQNSIASQKNFS